MKLKNIIGSTAAKWAACLLATASIGGAWGAYTPTHIGGEGTENNPYTIGSAEALAEMAAYFDDPGKTTTYIKITQDFSCSNVNYEPPIIGSQGSGTRLAGHTVYIYADEPVVISGLTVSKAGNVGLIGEVHESTVLLSIKNITLSGVTIDGNNTSANGAGAFVGWSAGNALVLDNCHVVNSTVGNSKQTGGLVGYLMGNGTNPYATFTDCSIENSTINAGTSAVGGFVGYCCVETATITRGTSSGNTFNSTLQNLVGSFVGRFNSSTTVGTLSDITASGNKAVLSSSETTDIPYVGTVLNGATYTVVESASPVVTFLLRDEVGDMTIQYDSSVYTIHTQDGVQRSGAAVYNYMTQTVANGDPATEPTGEPSYWYHSGKTFPVGNNDGIPFSVEQSQAYVFDGWRLSGESVRYDFSAPVTSDITLVPHFSAVEAVFEIYTEADLFAFAREVALGRSYRSKVGGAPRQTVRLMNNITLTSNWTPIPGNFHGIFDGNDYAISGLVINDTTNDETGFFRTSGKSGNSFVVTDLTFQNPSVTSTGSFVGVLVGQADCVTVTNVTVNNPTVLSTSTDNVGGLVGSVNNNVEVPAAVSAFSGCSVNGGTLSCTGSDGRMVGGLFGQALRYITITDCSVTDVTINGYRKLGGLIGQANEAYLTCTGASVSGVTLNALGNTSYAKDLTMGGFVGQFANSRSSSFTGTVSDLTMTGPESIASGKNYVMGWVSGGTAGTVGAAETAMTGASMTFDVTVSGTNTRTVSNDSTYVGINGTLPYVAEIDGQGYLTFAAAIDAAETYATAHGGVYPTITVLNGATEQDNSDWKIANGKLVKKVYVAAAYDANDALIGRYENVQSAIDATGAKKVVMLANVQLPTLTNPTTRTGALVVAPGKDITLDLAGYTISCDLNSPNYPANAILVWIKGKLTLEDSSGTDVGTIINTCANSSPFTRTVSARDGGELVMNGGTITSVSGNAMQIATGTVTINGGVVKTTNTTYPESGAYDDAHSAICMWSGSTLNINAGTISSSRRYALYSYETGISINIAGGVIAGFSPNYGYIKVGGSTQTITGGYFSSDPSKYVDLDAYLVGQVEDESSPLDGYYEVAKINERVPVTVTTFAELKAALAGATITSPVAITVDGDIVIDEPVTLGATSKLIVNEGRTLSIKDNGVLFQTQGVENNGTLSVSGNGFLTNPTKVDGEGSLVGYQSLENEPYVVSTAMDLQWLAYLNAADETEVFDVIFDSDITIPNGVVFEPIPYFSGVFDGKGHSVNGLVLKSTSENLGLITCLYGDTLISDLTINATVRTMSGYAGALAYRSIGKTHITGVTLNGTISVDGTSYGVAPFVANVQNSNSHLYVANCTNNISIAAPLACNVAFVAGTAAAASSCTIGVYNFTNTGSLTASNAGGVGYAVAYMETGHATTLDIINYTNVGSGNLNGTSYDASNRALFCTYHNIWSVDNDNIISNTYASTDYTAYCHEDEDIYNTEPPPPPPVAAIVNTETVLDMWNFWWMEGMVDAENKPCPQYVSITDETLYRDLGVEDDAAEEAWVSAKYLYDNYLADGKPDAGNAQYFVYAPGAQMTKYESLAAALADVPANNAETVTILLIADNALACNSSSPSIVVNKNNVVIDGQGLYKITTDGSSDWDKYKVGGASQRFGQYNLVTVTGTNVTLKDMTIDVGECRGVSCATTLGGRDVTYDGVTYVGRGSAHYYGYGNGTITFTNCTINTQGYAIHCSNENVVFELVVDSCTVNGWMSCGKATGLTIKDSHFGGADDTGKNGLLAKLRAYCNTTIENTTFSTDYLYVNDSVSTYCGIDCGIGSLHISLDGCSVVDAEGNPTDHDITEAIKTWNGDGENFANAVYQIDLQGDATAGYTGGKFVTDTGSVTCAEGYAAVKTGRLACYDVYEIVALKTVTFALGENAPDGSVAPAKLTYPSGSATDVALPLPTYAAESTTFAGWKVKDSDPEVILSAIPAGANTDYELVATWTGAQKVTITESEETAEITVTDAWIQGNVTPAGEEATPAEIQEALNKVDDNGLKAWENYVLGLDGSSPNANLSADAEQGPVSATPITSNVDVPPVDTGFKVEYKLVSVDTNGTTVTEGALQPTPDLTADIAAMTSETNVVYYKTVAVITSTQNPEVKVEVESDNTIGVLKVESGAKTTAIAVPWEALGGGDISVSNIVRTATLTPGDELKAYAPDGKYKAWELDENKVWQPVTVVGGSSEIDADAFRVPRGSAVWLTRQDTTQPIYLVGEVAATEKAEVTLAVGTTDNPSWNLVGSAGTEPVNVNEIGAATTDKIIVPTATVPKNYEYNTEKGEWGYWDYETVVKPNGRKTVTKVWKTAEDIPAGTGFWYLNGGDSKDINL